MAVSVSNGISIRLWRGYDDPGLPVGMYFGQNAVTGDMTGGSQTVLFVFKGANEPVSGRFFNVEQINVMHTDTVVKNGFVQATNFETLGPVGLVNRQWRLRLQPNTNGVAAMSDESWFPLPLFLGSVAPVPALSAQVEVGVDNVTVSSFIATIQGYIWEPRSVQAPGGLRRPLDSLYGK